MSETLGILGRLERWGERAETALLVFLLGGMMLLAVAQIVLREIFNSGLIWADEMLKLAVLWLAMIAAVAAARDNRHIRVDVMSHILPQTFLRYTRAVVDLFAAVVCAVLAWHAWRYLQLEREFEDVVLVGFPAWIAHVVVPAAFALSAWRFVIGATRRFLEPQTQAGAQR